MMGCISRINDRLYRLCEERDRAAKPNGNGKSLVVVKMQLVNRAFAKLGMNLRSSSRRTGAVPDQGAFSAGVKAGNGATFNRPINNGNGVRQLTSA